MPISQRKALAADRETKRSCCAAAHKGYGPHQEFIVRHLLRYWGAPPRKVPKALKSKDLGLQEVGPLPGAVIRLFVPDSGVVAGFGGLGLAVEDSPPVAPPVNGLLVTPAGGASSFRVEFGIKMVSPTTVPGADVKVGKAGVYDP